MVEVMLLRKYMEAAHRWVGSLRPSIKMYKLNNQYKKLRMKQWQLFYWDKFKKHCYPSTGPPPSYYLTTSAFSIHNMSSITDNYAFSIHSYFLKAAKIQQNKCR